MHSSVSQLLFLLLFLSLNQGVLTINLVEYTHGETILCLGDSLTYGMYVTPDDETGQSSHSYSLQLAKSLKSGSVTINAGTNGATLTDMLTALPALLTTHNPLAVIILGGTNDLIRGGANATYDRMVGTLAQIHKLALGHVRADKKKVVTVAVTIPPVDGLDDDQDTTRNKVNIGLTKLPDHHPRVSVCDLAAQTQFSFANKYSPFWSPDGVHLSSTGYDVLGKLIFNTLLESRVSDRSHGRHSSGD